MKKQTLFVIIIVFLIFFSIDVLANEPPVIDGIPDLFLYEDRSSDVLDLWNYSFDPDNDLSNKTISYYLLDKGVKHKGPY